MIGPCFKDIVPNELRHMFVKPIKMLCVSVRIRNEGGKSQRGLASNFPKTSNIVASLLATK